MAFVRTTVSQEGGTHYYPNDPQIQTANMCCVAIGWEDADP
jgi:hypothetical protein